MGGCGSITLERSKGMHVVAVHMKDGDLARDNEGGRRLEGWHVGVQPRTMS